MLVALATAKARAADCPGNPNALGTSRVMAVDPQRISPHRHGAILPFVAARGQGGRADLRRRPAAALHQPRARRAGRELRQGQLFPGRPHGPRLSRSGPAHPRRRPHHRHPQREPSARLRPRADGHGEERDRTGHRLGRPRRWATRTRVAPFFRIPGFLRRQEVEAYLQSRHLATWSADLVADDWRHINASEVVRRAMARLDEKGKGILLLHDIQPATALALPELLRELKAKGYRIVQVVPGKTATSVPVRRAGRRRERGRAVSRNPPAPWRPRCMPAIVPREARRRCRAAAAGPAGAADSLARGEDVPRDPARPFTSGSKPSRTMPTPGKFVTTEPGGWPPSSACRCRAPAASACPRRSRRTRAGRPLPVALS